MLRCVHPAPFLCSLGTLANTPLTCTPPHLTQTLFLIFLGAIFLSPFPPHSFFSVWVWGKQLGLVREDLQSRVSGLGLHRWDLKLIWDWRPALEDLRAQCLSSLLGTRTAGAPV